MFFTNLKGMYYVYLNSLLEKSTHQYDSYTQIKTCRCLAWSVVLNALLWTFREGAIDVALWFLSQCLIPDLGIPCSKRRSQSGRAQLYTTLFVIFSHTKLFHHSSKSITASCFYIQHISKITTCIIYNISNIPPIICCKSQYQFFYVSSCDWLRRNYNWCQACDLARMAHSVPYYIVYLVWPAIETATCDKDSRCQTNAPLEKYLKVR